MSAVTKYEFSSQVASFRTTFGATVVYTLTVSWHSSFWCWNLPQVQIWVWLSVFEHVCPELHNQWGNRTKPDVYVHVEVSLYSCRGRGFVWGNCLRAIIYKVVLFFRDAPQTIYVLIKLPTRRRERRRRALNEQKGYKNGLPLMRRLHLLSPSYHSLAVLPSNYCLTTDNLPIFYSVARFTHSHFLS